MGSGTLFNYQVVHFWITIYTRENVRCAYCGVTEEWQTLDMFDGNRSNYTDRNFAPATVRYLRLFVVAPTQGQDSAARIYEFEVY